MPHLVPLPGGLHAALRTDAWFAGVPESLQQALLDRSQAWRLADGESLFARGGAAQGLCCVLAGALRIQAVHEDGGIALLACVEPYQWFGEISVIDGLPRTHDAVADGDVTVMVVHGTSLQAWLEAHPAMWREIGRLACRKLRTAFVALEELAQLPLEQRVGRRLCMLAEGYGSRQGQPRRRVRLEQEALAQMLGVSRQSVNKALRALEAKGLIHVGYGEIEVLQPDKL